jgi:hypothetical protein
MNDNVLFTSGPDLPYWKDAEPRIVAYAERMGARLEVMSKRPSGNPQWAIFDAMSATPEGSTGAWVDADIIIAKDAPSIFQYGSKLMVCEPSVPRRVHPKWRRGHSHCDIAVPNMRPYPVTGVAAWGSEVGKRIAEWVRDFETSNRCRPGWGDQEVLALAIWELDIGMHYFPSNLHRMLGMDVRGLRHVSFAHAAGSNRKGGRMKNFEAEMASLGR